MYFLFDCNNQCIARYKTQKGLKIGIKKRMNYIRMQYENKYTNFEYYFDKFLYKTKFINSVESK